ncbi:MULTISPECIES: NUDIX domain-containing protein [unclassified Streptomyces]|uniref:NUDIX domain-containing protein n=1 Tax=unclassified Streptomyces TaxID=2593676 RepID=UPI00224F64AE|nr:MULTISPECIES: NUDIX domain-containing protein [unclassified Streptomyces]WSP53167.1 NUDIX domain-containing protein [Streptomyces sp. NBC_01241]WSU26114.1 NUDIX domain-containing protein [Streptomyces sp. NBC_01108]MCX4799500.1 NUDIX domain-containing protein [Streptomyces sp. NBC_01242]WSJ40678.1 NUDIX domain-containing protein [Streptomyces sp. NBC_01321]WSP66997.1 NUDIX domain-containing protein [Streptomyces sp. NBC_01240]
MRADESETAAPDPRPTPRRQATEPRVSARAVVLNAQGEILLVRHRDQDREFYVLPGGRVEPGETSAEAVRREVLEETGLSVRVGELRWVREYLPQRHQGDPHHTTRLQQLQLYFDAYLEHESAAAPPGHPDRTQSAVVWHAAATVGELALLPAGLTGPVSDLADGRPGPCYLGDLP